VISLVRHITGLLSAAYPEDEARALAWWILEETTGLTRTQLLTGCKFTTFSPHMQAIVDRLLKKEPIQYIFGHTLWCGLDLRLTPATLIPRPETAELIDRINENLQIFQSSNPQIRLLDVGTGSGCIALALKQQHPDWQVTGLDISAEALKVARENAARNGLEVRWLLADILTDEIERYDLIVSNPPYIAEQERPSMDRNVLDYEPHSALFVPDDDPLRFYRRIAELRRATWLFFEINPRYADEMQQMMQALGYTDIELYHDSYGTTRILSGRIATEG
jgi:release factor glutamine methyltransferase